MCALFCQYSWLCKRSENRHCVTAQKTPRNRHFSCRKVRLIFSVFYSHGSKEKICPTYFEIGRTYFKIQGTYFSLSENPFEKRPENVDKKAAFAVEYRKRWKFVLCMKVPKARSVRIYGKLSVHSPNLVAFHYRSTCRYESRLIFRLYRNI